MALQAQVYKIKGVVQHYSWGGYAYIPALLDINNTEQKPFAEYWLGSHPNFPSVIEDSNETLDRFIQNDPSVMGRVKELSLPFLLKVLDVRNMLSIQVHPSKEEAKKGYALEEEKGLPVKAPERNYKDENHKPEMMIALSDFWLLHGFKEPGALERIFDTVPELHFLQDIFDTGGYKLLFERVMELPQEQVNEILQPLLDRIMPLYKDGKLDKNEADFWAARAALTFNKGHEIDRGIFSIYLFNVLHLKKVEGIFQGAGMPHAYLEGQNVEVMANSDNVLRAGLTDKHIDVP
jgi:mannose-6-phosphate isomerase